MSLRVADEFVWTGVPILHLIDYPWSSVRHHPNDTKSNLHFPTIDNVIKILRVFVFEYLHISPWRVFVGEHLHLFTLNDIC